MVKSIDQTGQLPQVGGTEAKPDFKGSEVVKDEKAQSLHKGSSVSHRDQPIEERDAEILDRSERTADRKIEQLLGMVEKLQQKSDKPIDIVKAESDLKELQADFTMAYDVVNLMGDGEEVVKVRGFLENILSIIKSLLIFIGIMKEVDAKGNLSPEKQAEADEHLKAAEEGVLKLGSAPSAPVSKKAAAKALPIEKGPALPDLEVQQHQGAALSSVPPIVVAAPPPPPMPGERAKTSSPPQQMPASSAPKAEAEKPLRPSVAALLQGAGNLRKANVAQDKPEAAPTGLAADMAARRGALQADEDEFSPEEFEDDFYVAEEPKAPTPPPVTKKEAAPTQSVVKRPMAAPADLLSAIRKGRGLNKVEQENKPPVQTQKSQKDVFAGSKLLQQAQQIEPDEDEDEWKD